MTSTPVEHPSGREQSAKSRFLGCLFLTLGFGALVLIGALVYVARHHHREVFGYAVRNEFVAPIRLVLAFNPRAGESSEAAGALHYALEMDDGFAYANRLMEAGLDANQDDADCGALARSLNLREYEPVAWLIERGADPGRDPSAWKFAPLHVLCWRVFTDGADAAYHLRVAELLVASGADANARDAMKRSPLDHALGAASDGGVLATEWWPFVERLTELGADPALLRPAEQTALLELALEAKDDEAFLRFARAGLSLGPTKRRGKPPRLPRLALFASSTEPMELLIERGFDIDAPIDHHPTWLRAAIGYGNAAAVELLLRRGADPNAPSANGGGPLRDAFDRRDPELAKLLLDAGADPNATAVDGSPLLAASLGGRRQAAMALLLVAAGADPNRAGRDGATPLSLAARHGETAVADALLAAGADPTLADRSGKTPLDLAKSRGHAEIVALLEAAFSDELASEPAAVESSGP